MAGEYSVVTAIFELWLVLMKFSPELPTLLSFYHDFVGHLSVEELNELAERQGLARFTPPLAEVPPPDQESGSVLVDQRQHPTPPAGALQQAVPPPPQPLPPSRRRDRRLPRSGGKCPLIGRADIRLRVNISSVLNTFGPSGGGTDTHPSSPDSPSSPVWEQPRKRKRTEWLEVDSTVTLGTRPRNFIILLAEKCGILDIQKEIRDFMSAGSFSANNGTLPSLIAAHNHHSQNINVSAFWQSVIEIQIALRCESIGKGPRDIWDLKLSGLGKEVMTRGRFIYLHGEGKKLCRLIAGATLHIVPLVAFCTLKSKVRDMTVAELSEVSRLFRTPGVDPSLAEAVGNILATLTSLHSHVNFKMHTLAGHSRCMDRNVPQVITSVDLAGSDRFFDSIVYRQMILPLRSSTHWSQWSDYLPPQDFALGTLAPELTEESFDNDLQLLPLSDENMVKVVCTLNPTVFKDAVPKEIEASLAWTRTQRSKANGCDAFNTVDELTTWLNKLPPSGKSVNRLYKRIQPKFDGGKSVQVVGSDGELIFLVLKSMPYRYRTKIQQVVQACYPKDFVQSESGKVALKAKHFCVWNQYTESGLGAPEDIHPNDLVRSTQQDGSFLPRHRLPFLSKAITEDGGTLYSQLSTGLSDVFEWLSQQIEEKLPEHFSSLSKVFHDLPFEPGFEALYPFTKLVVNLGAQTEGHTDPKDDGLCVVIPFGNWEGGELCLYHPGVALELEPGDVVAFPSDRISHFNLEMSGLRGSLVLATDRDTRSWTETRNGWGHAIH